MKSGMHDWLKHVKRYSRIAAAYIAILVLIGVVVAKSTVTGRHLLIIGAIWLLGVCAWVFLPKAEGLWGVKFSGRHRTVGIVIVYLFAWTYQFLLFGWLIPLSIGIYRVMLR
jgi:hypothetical protein